MKKKLLKKPINLLKIGDLKGKLKFEEGDSLDIPFVDSSFEGFVILV
jgi:hypothetical protein